jgi:hypothetical protein
MPLELRARAICAMAAVLTWRIDQSTNKFNQSATLWSDANASPHRDGHNPYAYDPHVFWLTPVRITPLTEPPSYQSLDYYDITLSILSHLLGWDNSLDDSQNATARKITVMIISGLGSRIRKTCNTVRLRWLFSHIRTTDICWVHPDFLVSLVASIALPAQRSGAPTSRVEGLLHTDLVRHRTYGAARNVTFLGLARAVIKGALSQPNPETLAKAYLLVGVDDASDEDIFRIMYYSRRPFSEHRRKWAEIYLEQLGARAWVSCLARDRGSNPLGDCLIFIYMQMGRTSHNNKTYLRIIRQIAWAM